MAKVRSRLAHGLTGAGLSFGINQAAPGGLTPAIGAVVPVAVGFIWEFGLQRVVAMAFPRWDPKPRAGEVLDWVVGSAVASIISALL